MKIGFVIPVRHFSNMVCHVRAKRTLSQTLLSITTQSCASWQGVVVANRGTDLPVMPNGISHVLVDFEPNALHERGVGSVEVFHEAVRLDKGRRVLAGLRALDGCDLMMVVDDDDFVSQSIASYFSSAEEFKLGYVINRGYLWKEGARSAFLAQNFNILCGSSVILNIHHPIVEAARSTRVPLSVIEDFGSHRRLVRKFRSSDLRFNELPFEGAVYRLTGVNAHSRSRGVNLDRWPLLRALRNIQPAANAFGHVYATLRGTKSIDYLAREFHVPLD